MTPKAPIYFLQVSLGVDIVADIVFFLQVSPGVSVCYICAHTTDYTKPQSIVQSPKKIIQRP